MALKVQGQNPILTIGKFTMGIDSVDGLWYTPDLNGTLLASTTGAGLSVALLNRAKNGDKVTGIATGMVIAIANAAIAVGAPVTNDVNGRVKTATIATDLIKGYCWPVAAAAGGDVISIVKTA